MSLGNGNYTEGNKGSNHGYEHRSLLVLGQILAALGGSPVVTTRTPTATREIGSGLIAAGSQSVSIYNSGTAAGTILGTALNPGEMVSFSAGDAADELGAIAYDATGTNFLITTLT